MSAGAAFFVVDRIEENFAVLTDGRRHEYYISLTRTPELRAVGRRVAVPRDGRGKLDWSRMTVVDAGE